MPITKCQFCDFSAKYQIGNKDVCKKHVSKALDDLFKNTRVMQVQIKRYKEYKAYFEFPMKNQIHAYKSQIIVSDNEPLDKAIEELKRKGFTFIKKIKR
jgi:hypothetical protein